MKKCPETIVAVTKCRTAHFVIAIGMVGVLYLSSIYNKGLLFFEEIRYILNLYVMQYCMLCKYSY